MKAYSERLRAGEPLLLPSGTTLRVIVRTRTSVHGVGGWRGAFVQREPYALMLRAADGSFSVLPAGAEPDSLARLLSRLNARPDAFDTLGASLSLAPCGREAEEWPASTLSKEQLT